MSAISSILASRLLLVIAVIAVIMVTMFRVSALVALMVDGESVGVEDRYSVTIIVTENTFGIDRTPA